jgi:hypothetical protein
MNKVSTYIESSYKGKHCLIWSLFENTVTWMSSTRFQAKLNTPPKTKSADLNVHHFAQRVLWNSCNINSNVICQILDSVGSIHLKVLFLKL